MSVPVEALSLLEPTYTPNQKVGESLRSKYLVAVIGAFAVGKTTLIRAIDERHEAYSEVISFTTRPTRGPGDFYRFLDHTDTNLTILSAKANKGELVNFSVHPTTGYVYGSEVGDYKSSRCMLATTSKSFESDRHLPFARVIPLVVVADASVWLARTRERSTSAQDLSARLSEAQRSLLWSLEQGNVYFVDNTLPNIDAVSDRVVVDIEADGRSEPSIRNIAYRMLRAATTNI